MKKAQGDPKDQPQITIPKKDFEAFAHLANEETKLSTRLTEAAKRVAKRSK